MARPSGLAYSIHTPRLILRCWYPTDATLLQRVINENVDYLRPWMEWARQEPETLEMKTERLRRFRDDFLSRRDFVYGIFGADGVRIVGGTGLHTRESKDAREIRCDPRNRASARVAEKLGFTHRSTLYGNKTDAEGRLRDTMVWSLDSADYAGSPASTASVAAYNRSKIQIL